MATPAVIHFITRIQDADDVSGDFSAAGLILVSDGSGQFTAATNSSPSSGDAGTLNYADGGGGWADNNASAFDTGTGQLNLFDNIALGTGRDIRFNGANDANWRILVGGEVGTQMVGGATSLQAIVGTGTEGPDGFVIAQCQGGNSIAEFRGYDQAIYLAGIVTFGSDLHVSGHDVAMAGGQIQFGTGAVMQDDGGGGVDINGGSAENGINIGQNGNLNLYGNALMLYNGSGTGGNDVYTDGGQILFADLSGNYDQTAAIAGGSFDNGGGGGVSLLCSVGYELNWQYGQLTCPGNPILVASDLWMYNSHNLQMQRNLLVLGTGGYIQDDNDGGINFIDNGDRVLNWNAWDNNGLQLNGANLVLNNASGAGGGGVWLDGATVRFGTGGSMVDNGTGGVAFSGAVQIPTLNMGAGGTLDFYDTLYLFDTDNNSPVVTVQGPATDTPGATFAVPVFVNGYAPSSGEVLGVGGDAVVSGALTVTTIYPPTVTVVSNGATPDPTGTYTQSTASNDKPTYTGHATNTGNLIIIEWESGDGGYWTVFDTVAVVQWNNGTLYGAFTADGGATGSPSISLAALVEINALEGAGGNAFKVDGQGNATASAGLGLWGASPPAAQPAGGAATAGSLYTSNEQTMLQAVYSAMRAYGMIT